jgi:hypothetical protein
MAAVPMSLKLIECRGASEIGVQPATVHVSLGSHPVATSTILSPSTLWVPHTWKTDPSGYQVV